MLKRGLLITLMTLVLCACQGNPDTTDYNGNTKRQKECDRILAQLGVSGDDVLNAEVASTPERQRLVGLYSAYGCDK